MAGNKRRSFSSSQGGLLNRMFGSSSSPEDKSSAIETKSPTDSSSQGSSLPDGNDGGKSVDAGARSVQEDGGSDKRTRRSSGIGRMFNSAKQSFSSSGSPTRTPGLAQTPIQKLGQKDPALNVPQGSLNNAAGESVPGPRSTFRVGVTEDKNRKCRRTMEDTHAYLYNFLSTPAPTLEGDVNSETRQNLAPTASRPVVETDNGYFAIFDGHAGTFAAEWCGKKLHIILEDNIRKNPNKPIPELLDETFTMVDTQLEKLPLKNSGCTAVIAVLRWEDRIPNSQSATGSTAIASAVAKELDQAVETAPGGSRERRQSVAQTEARLRENASRQRVLYTANVGDARIVLCRNGKALRLSYDHKGSDDNEGKRIANAGGLILNNRVNGVLAVTRALGDTYMKDLVTGHPYTTETVIQPDIDEFLILACDGLWDVCSDQEAVDLIRSVRDPQAASKMLVEHALNRFSTDNLSCMIVRFNTRAVQDTVEQRVEPIGVEGDPHSTVRGGVTEIEAIVGGARRSMPSPEGKGNELSPVRRITTNELLEEQEEQEDGPELDSDGLRRAREKAKEGQNQVGMASSK